MRKKFKLFHCAIIILLHHLHLVHPAIRDEEINIAAIFQSANVYNPSLAGFEDGVRYANSYILRGMRLKPTITYVTNDDSFEAINSVCQLIQQKSIWAMFTAQSLPINWIIPSIANNLQIPNIQTIWDYSNSKKIFDVDLKTNFTINLYPDASMLSKAYRDWTDSSDIKALTIIYERKEDLIFIKDLLELNSQSNKVRISIKEHIVEGSDFKKMLKDSKRKNGDNFILAIPLDKIELLIKQADELNLVTEYNKYLITNLDAFTLNYDYLENNNKNITTLSLINVELLKNEPFVRFASDYKHDHALMFDAVTTFAKALYQLKNSAYSIQSPVVSCSRGNRAVWKGGQIILNHIKNSMFDGLTGPIMFNENGQRVNFTMRILSIQQYETQYNQTGYWTIDDGVQIARTKTTDPDEDVKNMLRNRRTPIKVATMIDREPYIFKNPEEQDQLRESEFFNPVQNYTGFCVELLEKLKERLGFEYELVVMNTTASAPLLEEVKQQRADIAIADITITKERQLEVDFTMPFLSLGVAILYSKSSVESKDLFSFMQPFHMKVWLLLGTAILGVSLVMYIISRISPYEWVSSHPCEDEPEEMENQFSLGNCIWFVLGSIMQQGSDLAPRAPSTRLLANVWAFFTLIMTSSYTANLAAVLTLSGMEADITSVEALAKQTKVKYGLQGTGSTHKFFANSQHPTYQRMFSYMESIEKTEKVYAKDNAEGVKRVINGGYAYLMESITLDFFTNQFCNLTQIGNLLDRKGYGIALKQGSPYTSLFSTAILKLQEEQYLSDLRTKWFKSFPAKLRQIRTPFLTECPKIDVASSGAKEMNVTDVGGVIIVMVVGLIIGILFSLAEIWWKAKKIRRDEREPVCTLIWREFRRILALGGSSTTDNPLLLTKSSSTSNANVAGSNPRSSMVPGDDEKTLKSAKQPDIDSNKGDGKRQPRNRSNTGLSKKGTSTTLNSPAYNLSMNTTGLPSVNHRESNATGYSQPFNNSGTRDFEDNNLLNNSVEMNPINPVRVEPLGGSQIIEPPPGFDNHHTQVKQPYDGQQYPGSFLPQTAQFDPYLMRDLNNQPMNGLHGAPSNGMNSGMNNGLINGGLTKAPYSSQTLNSSGNRAKSPKSRKKTSSADQQPVTNQNNLRRRSYLTESPIKWPQKQPNNYDDVYE